MRVRQGPPNRHHAQEANLLLKARCPEMGAGMESADDGGCFPVVRKGRQASGA